VTPPGFKTASLNTTQCATGEYRADWKPANLATNCLSCGVGVYANQTDRVAVYDLMDPTNVTYLPVTSSSDDCCKSYALFVAATINADACFVAALTDCRLIPA